MDESDFIYNDILERAEKLERFFDRIISCHVTVSAPVYVTIRHAFEAARRRLEDLVGRNEDS